MNSCLVPKRRITVTIVILYASCLVPRTKITVIIVIVYVQSPRGLVEYVVLSVVALCGSALSSSAKDT